MKNQEQEVMKAIQKMESLSKEMEKANAFQKIMLMPKIISIYSELYQTAYTDGHEDGYQKKSEELTKLN